MEQLITNKLLERIYTKANLKRTSSYLKRGLIASRTCEDRGQLASDSLAGPANVNTGRPSPYSRTADLFVEFIF